MTVRSKLVLIKHILEGIHCSKDWWNKDIAIWFRACDIRAQSENW